MDLSVVIVNWNTRDLLAQCLRSVASCQMAVDGYETDLPAVDRLEAEVFVVDNASADGSAAMVREEFPWVRLIENAENAGFAAANNQVLRRARGRYVVLLNSDTEILPDALPLMVEFMDAHAGAGGAGACLLNPDGSLQPSCHPMLTPGREFWRLLFLERIWRRATYPMHRWDAGTPRQVDVIKGACLLLRREALNEVGLLDEGYFMYTEEVDLCYRLARAGWELWWVPQAKVVHHEAGSTRQMAEEMYIQLYRSKVQFYHKSGGQRRATRFKRLLRLAYWPRLAAAMLASPLSGVYATRARTYRRLLSELAAM